MSMTQKMNNYREEVKLSLEAAEKHRKDQVRAARNHPARKHAHSLTPFTFSLPTVAPALPARAATFTRALCHLLPSSAA
jgi:hypothetical protein